MSAAAQRRVRSLAVLVTLAGVFTSPLTADASDTLEGAIADGKTSIALRYRYEFVDQDGFADDANASTARLRLNYASGAWQGWSGFVEFDHLAELFIDDFNSGGGTSPGRTRYPTVADPKGSDLNQLYIDYAGTEGWRLRLGRQRILLDNQRFVGGVGWRQNEQTYDGLSVKYAEEGRSEVFYAFVTNVNRIFGDDVPAGDHSQSTHLLNAKFALAKDWHLSAYGYFIDNDDAPAFSTATIGARLRKSFPMEQGTLALTGELAYQSDAGNAPVDYDAGYGRFDLNWALSKVFSAGIGFETLEGDANSAGRAFRTPLATLHAFNGWADKFLGTPGGGIDDLYLSFGYNPTPWKLNFVFHDFSAESGGGDYGSELDFAASRKLGERHSVLVKFARFDADGASGLTDTTKLWVMFSLALL